MRVTKLMIVMEVEVVKTIWRMEEIAIMVISEQTEMAITTSKETIVGYL